MIKYRCLLIALLLTSTFSIQSINVGAAELIPWPEDPRITPLAKDPERYRDSLEKYRESTEKARESLERNRENEKIGGEKYKKEIDRYHENINNYKRGIENYKERF